MTGSNNSRYENVMRLHVLCDMIDDGKISVDR